MEQNNNGLIEETPIEPRPSRPLMIVVSAPSGAGKSTILRDVLARTGANFSVSATTRQPREGEIEGKDYCFVSRERFEEMIERGELLEWAEVFGNLYGTPAAPVRDAVARGGKIILDIDVQGASQVYEKMPEATFVLIEPPSLEELQHRLRQRNSETQDSLQRRLGKARREIETARDSGVYNHVVVNDDLARAIEEVVAIVTQQE